MLNMKEGENLKKFEDKLKHIRKEKGITQKALGEMIGASEVMVGQWERGIRIPKFEVRQKIAKALGVNHSYLMDWDEQHPNVTVEAEKHDIFVAFMKSLGFDVTYYPEPYTIPVENVPNEFKDEIQGNGVEGETFTVSVMYADGRILLDEDEFNKLQSQITEVIEVQLWKLKKRHTK